MSNLAALIPILGILGICTILYMFFKYSSNYGGVGLILGAYIGYLNRPSVLGNQMDIIRIINILLNPPDQSYFSVRDFGLTMAQNSLVSIILGAFVGLIVGSIIKRK